jgi:putative transposase
MPFVKVYIHFVWSTKNRVQTLNTPELRQKVFKSDATDKRGICLLV